MPQNKFALARYRLIDSLLRKYEFVKTKDIVERCVDEFGFQVTQRTIQMDMNTLREDPFIGCFFPIEYNHRQRAYFYSEKPKGFFLSLCVIENEYIVLKNLCDFLKNKIMEEDYLTFCSFFNRIQNYLNYHNNPQGTFFFFRIILNTGVMNINNNGRKSIIYLLLSVKLNTSVRDIASTVVNKIRKTSKHRIRIKVII